MERNSKLLSVIVPVYKAEQYLHRCIDSILAQTWTNLEIILVEDGSPDGCGAICDDYAEKDSRVRVIHKTNGGVASARNAGIDSATGEYIAFVDSDDYIAPEMYEKLLGALTTDNAIAVCDCFLHYPDMDIPKVIYEVGDDKTHFLAEYLISDIGGSCWNMIIPALYVSKLRFPTYLGTGEDLWFVLRLLTKAERLVKVQEPLYYYNQSNVSSITHTLSEELDKNAVLGLKENKEFLIESGFFHDVEKEWSWAALRYKSVFLMTPRRFKLYRTLLPEVNSHIKDCPLISESMKLIMSLLNNHLDVLAAPLVLLYRLKRCVTHT